MSPDLHHLSGAYAVDALDERERAGFEQHLAGCPDCRAEVAELTAAAQSLAALTETEPPASLRASVLGGISQIRPLPPLADETGGTAPAEDVRPGPTEPAAERPAEPAAERPSGQVLPFRRRAVQWFAAAAAAAAVVAGALVWSPWSDAPASPYDQVVAAADARTVSSSKDGATAEVVYSRQLGRSAISVSGLPSAPAGRTYQLWYVGRDDVMHPAGLFNPDATGHARTVLAGDATTAAAVGVTLEPEGGSPQPTSDPLMVMALT